MKTNIKVKFKDKTERVFDANTFTFTNDGFCDLEFNEEDKSRGLWLVYQWMKLNI